MTCDKNPQKIKNMFDEISGYYDRVNNLISLGTHYVVKFFAVRELDIQPRGMVLDICCGTGDFTRIISKFYRRAKVIGLDFSEEMLKLAKSKNPDGVFVSGDCTNLPFKEEEFDYITEGFGLRNIEDRQKAVTEVYRVLVKGGKFLHLDFGRHNKISRIFDYIVPVFAKLSGAECEHYKYLLSSKDTFLEPAELVKEFEAAGFRHVKTIDYLFGSICAIIMQK